MRVVIADDHYFMAQGMRQHFRDLRLSAAPEGFEVAGVATNGEDLVAKVRELQPDLVFMDISMPKLNGFEAARQIRAIQPTVKILFVTMHQEADYVARAFAAGGNAYLTKNCDPTEIGQALTQLFQGNAYVSPKVGGGALLGESTTEGVGTHSLTPRQVEVLRLLARGHSIEEVATALRLSRKTIEYHKARMMKSQQLSTNADLLKFALVRGIT
jgi:DNA-binding NarL/FixJ family response regulator